MDGFDPKTTFGYETSTALPLLRAGVPVDGIEQSQHMVNRMREKLTTTRSAWSSATCPVSAPDAGTGWCT